MKRPPSVILLTLAGLFFVAMGLYFAFLRPSLLPEDTHYIGTTLTAINSNIPGLSGWLKKVFLVMGGYVFTTGLLTMYIAFTSFQMRRHGVFSIVMISGLSSIGLMTVINFMLVSDFKWFLFATALVWLASLVLYRLNK